MFGIGTILEDIQPASETVVRRCSAKKVFLEISQNLQENTCARLLLNKEETLDQVFSCKFCEISKNTSGGCFCCLTDSRKDVYQ